MRRSSLWLSDKDGELSCQDPDLFVCMFLGFFLLLFWGISVKLEALFLKLRFHITQ